MAFEEEFHKFVGAVKGYCWASPSWEGITTTPREGIAARNSGAIDPS
ncbi:MAG TPA: hypothetical protein VH643_24815 [Gemmataceae bacterium]